MSGSMTRLRALSYVDPEAAKARIMEAARLYNGVRWQIAAALDVSNATFWRIEARLGLTAELDALALHARAGQRPRDGVDSGS